MHLEPLDYSFPRTMGSIIDDHHSDEGEISGHTGRDHDVGAYSVMKMDRGGKAHCFDPRGRDG